MGFVDSLSDLIFCCCLKQNQLFGHRKMVLSDNYTQTHMQKKREENYKSNPVFYYLFTGRNGIAIFGWVSFFHSFRPIFVWHFTCVCELCFFSLPISIKFRISFLFDNNSSKFVNIWRYLRIMKWNKFQCKKQFFGLGERGESVKEIFCVLEIYFFFFFRF